MPAKIKQGKYVDSDGVQQNVVFIGAEKAIFDDNGTRLDNKLADMSKASGLTAEDAEGLLGTPDANVNFQALVDAIANKVMNELVTNSALTAQLANYVTNADLRDIFSGRDNYIDTLSSIQQLTTPGFYKIDNISSAVNDNAGSNPLSDYATGDFYGLLMGESMNSTNGCRYGTLILTSPRLAGVLWVGNIWDYKFAGWYKK